MSRPGSYHDHYVNIQDDFEDSLPLFNPQHPSLPPIQTSISSLPPPSSSASHQARHSIHHPPYPPQLQQSHTMTSAIPYSSHPYPQQHHQAELLPPPTASTSLGALARSASLGAVRRKDPFAFPSDDVESGMSAMDGGWGGYGRAPAHLQQQQQYQPHPPPQSRDIVMSPGVPRPYSNHQMQPPPVPAHALARPDNLYRQSSDSPRSSQAATNPYIPRGSDRSPSSESQSQGHWMEYRPTQNPGSSSYHSPGSEQLSPYVKPSNAIPGSPSGLNYDLSPIPAPQVPNLTMPTSPQTHFTDHQLHSPGPPKNARSHSSHQLYPASQPVTPASRTYDSGPPRTGMPVKAKVEKGFREVRDWNDLRPVVNNNPNGRRADPNHAGKYLSPLKCLTATLPQTYTLCNPSFRYESTDNPRRVLTKPSKAMYNDGADNEDMDYILYVNDVLGGANGGDRYLILDVLGQGTFGQVVKCQNMRTHGIVAVKVVKNKPAYLNQSKMEVAILDLLNREWDPNDERHILRMMESFTHKNHLCLVFECLSSNLYELIKQNQFKGLSLQLVKVFTQQLLDCLAVLKEARLIHCDLKPENILLKSLQSPQLKVIDFGSACHEMQTVYTYIQSRFYRSPEVLLGLPYSTAIDMWSLGCIVVELFLGLPLFPGTSEYNQLSRIVDMLGNPPPHLLEVGKQTHEFFNLVGVDAHGRKQYKLKPMEQYASEHRTSEQPSKQYFKQTKLPDIIMEYPFSRKNSKQSEIDKEMATRRAFVDFVGGLLNLDPIQRWSPQQAAKHPFITGEKYTGPFEPSKRQQSTPEVAPQNPTSSSKKYGGLVTSPSSNRQQRVYSDAAAYNHQLAQHQSYTAQVQNQNNAPRPGPFAPGYDVSPQSQPMYGQGRVVSQQHSQPQRQWTQPMPPQQNYQPPPAQNTGLSVSASHASLRQTTNPMLPATNPPPNSYHPSSRNRANTINQMDAIPPALARLTNLGAADPSGVRSALTPVLNRDEAIREWERRNAGHAKRSSMQTTSYPQLEYLQEQAELAAMGGQNWMMPGQYSHGHRSNHSSSGSGQFQMQPHIGVSSPSDYRPRPAQSDYEPPRSAGSFLPAYPPPAATSQPNSATFDAFDNRDSNLGLMYTPLQPSQAPYNNYPGTHGSRSSYSGPYSAGPAQNRNNPFASQNPANNGASDPRYNSRRGGGGGGSYQGA
ncbi:dual specificity protein kinase YAK1, partial [Tremellales sp. Uapishka_1]